MILRYCRKDGTTMEFELGDRPITIGRSSDADLVILDDKASRIHCGIRRWDGDFFLKDLKSRNGTYVNGERIDMVKLNFGDRIRVGSLLFSFEQRVGKGGQTILQEVADEMSGGKGYTTLLREIVEESEPPPAGDGFPATDATPPPLQTSFDAVVRLPSPEGPPTTRMPRIQVPAKKIRPIQPPDSAQGKGTGTARRKP
jgi:pSer/pThr/pTyr-binding forkhead associated (FHA) protein